MEFRTQVCTRHTHGRGSSGGRSCGQMARLQSQGKFSSISSKSEMISLPGVVWLCLEYLQGQEAHYLSIQLI